MGQAKALAEQFWDIQINGSHVDLLPLFADNAVFEDPAIGRVEGKPAIAKLLAHLDKLFAGNPPQFEVLEIAGDETVAWSRWIWKRPQGDVEGVGLYRVQDGKFISYRDVFAVPENLADSS
ncbi:nuclear transport factor 2 family protein [Parasphingorhabdus halotolerans]|uniref:Nuclear transport factor 2 family protein n=1 Tax=Parasphingorhabdus halotolerans TaxID=2725558 RepID=A0A6H2DMT4_9SPHN|nr:nuclear transport factor 2 family protein [Parasphingorhabdus halotolerans]QJB69982.1 nuclear transport factor 2 family protein [Parasphingorhabdus halotolerans]